VFGTDEVGDDFTQPQSVPDVAVEVESRHPPCGPLVPHPGGYLMGIDQDAVVVEEHAGSREHAAPTGVAPAG